MGGWHVCGIRYIHPYMYMKKKKVNVLGQDLSRNSSPFVLDSQEAPWTLFCPVSSSRAIGVHSLLHLAFMWVPGIRLRSSFLCSELFTHCEIFLDPTYFFFSFLLLRGVCILEQSWPCSVCVVSLIWCCSSGKTFSIFSHYAILVPVRSLDIAVVQRLQNGWASESPGGLLARADWIKMCGADSLFLTITLPSGVWEQWSGLSTSCQAEKHLQWNDPME